MKEDIKEEKCIEEENNYQEENIFYFVIFNFRLKKMLKNNLLYTCFSPVDRDQVAPPSVCM